MFKAIDYPITITELRSFQRDADKLFCEEERKALTDFLALNPSVGRIIPDTGGVRKTRWAAKGNGKRGGARIIYYFRDLNMPLFLLALYTKGEKLNLTASERRAMASLVDELVNQYKFRWENIVKLNRSTA